MAFQPQRVRDPLHDLIQFEPNKFDSVLWEVVNARPFQRLRRIKQLGFSEYVFPGATHTRFSHSLGVLCTARRLMKIVEQHLGQQNSYENDKAQAALAAALVHDVGHGPFSHAFEEVGKVLNWKFVKKHELVSDALIRDSEITSILKKMGSGFANDVADIVGSERPTSIYSAVVSSQFDADRLDYMRRDRLMTGTQHAGIDFEWLMGNLEVGTVSYGVDEKKTGDVETFVLGPKAIYAAEAYVLGLFQLYPTVYFHKTTRCFEKLFSQLLLRLARLVNDNATEKTGLDTNHSLVKFCKEPDKLECLLALDDACVSGAYSLMADAHDQVLASLATMIRDRKRLKCVDVRNEIAMRVGWQVARNSPDAITSSCSAIRLRVEEQLDREKQDLPSLLMDEGVREPYRQYDESKGPLNQIRIKVPETSSLDHVDLRERSTVVNAIEPFKFNRLYVSNSESEAFVQKLVGEEVQNVLSAAKN
jgi:uncharacterized protein